MGKVVVLGGNARSGKSTLSYMLAKNNYSIISFDNLYSVIGDGLNIDIDSYSNDIKLKLFETVVNKSLEESTLNDINIVIDMYDFLPEDINKLQNKDKIEVYFLAYPNCLKEEIKYNVIHYSKPTDWIAQVNEDYLDECVDRFYERNNLLVKECNKYKMNLIDTKSGEERYKVLKDLFNEIVK